MNLTNDKGETTPSARASSTLIPIVTAVIAACASVVTVGLTWFLTERIRTDIATQTLALERVKTDISMQTLALEKAKLDIANAAQSTAEMRTQLDQSRLELDRKTAKFTEYLGNKKVQIADKQSSTDEKRLAPEFSKLANALRPTFSISCGMESRQGLTLEVQCTFTNQGSNRATVTLRGVSIVDKQSLAELPGMVEQFTPPEGEGNTVLPGLTGSNTYFIRLTAAGLQSRQAALRIRFAAATDTVALNVVRRQSKGILTDEELNQLSVQGYVYHLRYN